MLDVMGAGVGNVGDFQKTFFQGGNVNVPEVQKHRTSLHKTSVLLRQNIGTLCQRSPMFLISGNGNVSGLRANSAIRERQRIRQNPVFTNKDPARTNSGNDAPPLVHQRALGCR